MKPASYQSMASSVMNPNISLGHLLSTPNVMRCEKCRFATTDISAFKKHVAQEHTEYYCFYCNRVSLSEAELQTHLQIHTGTSPFKCPHCGQVYMRRMCLIKHIERLHSKIVPQEPPNIPHNSVSSASQSVSSAASTAPPRPVVRVNVPAPTTAGVTLENNLERLKSLSSYMSNANHGDAVPLNGQVQRNRALTVSLPEEVSIPAGCMVEVAEVKTVDGTKELRLRFVAHQENESVIKNGRTTVPETPKVLSSQIKYPNAPSDSGMRFGNKNNETKIVNNGRPTLVPVNISKSFPKQTIKEQRSNAKRPSEVISLNAGVPSKIPRSFISVGDPKVASQKEPISHSITPAAMASMLANRLPTGSLLPESLSTLISLKGVEERKSSAPVPPPSSEPLMMTNVQILPRIVPMNRASTTVKSKEDPILHKNKLELTNPVPQNLKTLLLPLPPLVIAAPLPPPPPPPQVRVTNECKDKLVPKTFTPEQTSSQKASSELLAPKKLVNNTNMKMPSLPQEVKTEKAVTEDVRVEPEGFPVIYSVYSLSQQPSDPQESTQPIVMAEWTNSAGCHSPKIKSVRTEQSEMTGHQALRDLNDGKFTHDTLTNKISCESVKIEDDQDIQNVISVTPQNINLKKEKSTPAKDNKKSKMTPTKVNQTSSPVMDANITKTCSPPEDAKVSKTCSPSEDAKVRKTCSPSEDAKVRKTCSPSEDAKDGKTCTPPKHAKVSKTCSPSEDAKVSKTCTPPKHAKVSKKRAPIKHVKGNKTCVASSSTSLQPVNSGPVIPQPPMVSENISVQTPIEEKTNPESPPKFLTVSLKRVQVGISRKSKKKAKTVFKLSFAKVLEGPKPCAALQLLPLRKDQAVVQPSANQPVVVLNHPKPCVHMKTVPTKTLKNNGAGGTVTPKCQILKMKLCKVMGRKYEVMGCTIRNFS